MTRIKTTKAVKDTEVKQIIRTVQCPECYTFLKGISTSTIVIRCWSCNKEFRIEQDPSKWTKCEEPVLVQRLITE